MLDCFETWPLSFEASKARVMLAIHVRLLTTTIPRVCIVTTSSPAVTMEIAIQEALVRASPSSQAATVPLVRMATSVLLASSVLVMAVSAPTQAPAMTVSQVSLSVFMSKFASCGHVLVTFR